MRSRQPSVEVENAASKWNRREWLQGGVAMASLTFATSAQAAVVAPVDAWVDAHSHIWSREVDRFPLAKGQTVADLKPSSFTAEECLKLAATEGVGRVVLIQHHIYHGWDNSYLIDAASRYPDRFRVVGMIDDTQPHPDKKLRELLSSRVTALRITSLIRGADQWLAGPGMAALWKTAAETRQAMCCLINPQDLPSVDRMCSANPETPVVIDHFARIGMDGEIREADLKNLCGLAKHRHTHVKLSAYYALGKKQAPYKDMLPMIQRLVEAFGPQRLMWASDCPYQVQGGHTYRDSIALLRDHAPFLSADDKQWLLKKTAEKVYFL